MAQKVIYPLAAADSERFDGLEQAGFKVERFGDMHHHLNERQGGHYVDVGTSAKIAKGMVGYFSYLIQCILYFAQSPLMQCVYITDQDQIRRPSG
jgi:hypothetical protein